MKSKLSLESIFLPIFSGTAKVELSLLERQVFAHHRIAQSLAPK